MRGGTVSVKLEGMLSDAALVCGAGIACYGVSLLSVPAAWICGGVLLMGLGVVLGLRRA